MTDAALDLLITRLNSVYENCTYLGNDIVMERNDYRYAAAALTSLRDELRIARAALVPSDPTPTMVAAGVAAYNAHPYFEAAKLVAIWRAMYDAAIAKAEDK